MFKKILILVMVLVFPLCFAEEFSEEVIQGGIKYNEATARVAAFKDIERKIKRNTIKDYLKDPNRKENLKAIFDSKYSVDFERYLCPFYLKKTLISYAVTYYEDLNRVYYYNLLGNLIKFEIIEEGDYPKRMFAYSRFGNLMSVNFDIDGDEQFIYEENGKLIAHWQGDNYEGKHSKIFQITRGQNPNEDKDKDKNNKKLQDILNLSEEDLKED